MTLARWATLGAILVSLLVLGNGELSRSYAVEEQRPSPQNSNPIKLSGKELWVYSDLYLTTSRGIGSWGLQICGNLGPEACMKRITVAVSDPNVVRYELVASEIDGLVTVQFSGMEQGRSVVCLEDFGKRRYWTCKTLFVSPSPEFGSKSGYGLTIPRLRVPVGMTLRFYDDSRRSSNRVRMTTSNRGVLPEGQISNFFTFHAKKPGKARLCITYPKRLNPKFFRDNCASIEIFN
jgi:hypothetical protein